MKLETVKSEFSNCTKITHTTVNHTKTFLFVCVCVCQPQFVQIKKNLSQRPSHAMQYKATINVEDCQGPER